MVKIGLPQLIGMALLLNPIFAEQNLLKTAVSLGLENRLYAQTLQYPYKKYENRAEGLVKSRQLVEGEKLELLSAAIENNEAMPKAGVDKFHLAFCLQGTSRVKIIVREFEKVYKDVKMEYRMVPLQNQYPSGTNQFSWPAEIPLHYKLTIDDLVPLATAPGSEFDTIVPLLLFYAAPMNSAVSYRFCFFPLQTVSGLEYKIYRANPLEPVYSDKLRDLPGEQKIYLRWPGKDQSNKPAGSGLYNLVIAATFRALPGTNAKKMTATYQFYHDAEIMKKSQVRQ